MKPETVLSHFTEAKNTLIAHRRYLHENAEVGFDLHITRSYIMETLERMGYSPKKCGRIGVTATVGHGDGPVILLRADADALPVKEASGEAFSSRKGTMHACGHDMHTAMLLGAAEFLAEQKDSLHGTVKFMFQGAEESLSGAKDMIANGVLTDPAPSAALMIHVMTASPAETGTVFIPPAGVIAPAADMFSVEVRGKGCHGAMPSAGIDPLSVAARILLSFADIPAKEMPPSARSMVTVGAFTGGDAPNVIPDTATIRGSVRSFSEEAENRLKSRICEIAHHQAVSARAEASVTWGDGCPPFYQDGTIAEKAQLFLQELLADKAKAVSSFGGDAVGSEDFAYISREVPSVMLALSAGTAENGYKYPLHHPSVRFDEDALVTGAAVYAYIAMRYLESVEKE